MKGKFSMNKWGISLIVLRIMQYMIANIRII